MKADAQRALHRRVVRDELEEHEPRPDERLGEHERRGHQRSETHPVPARISAHGPDEQDERSDERPAAREAVRELDQRLDPRRPRQDLAVAGRPVPTAARARASGPYVRTPGHDKDLVSKEPPGETRKAAYRATSMRRHRQAAMRRHRQILDAEASPNIDALLSRRARCNPARLITLHLRPLERDAMVLLAQARACVDVTLELPWPLSRRRIPGPMRADRHRMTGYACSESSARKRCRRGRRSNRSRTPSARLVVVERAERKAFDDGEIADWIRDARRLSALDHPNVARVRDVIIRSGEILVVSEFVDGVRWREFAATTTLETALRVFVDALTGLSALHDLRDARDAKRQLFKLVHGGLTPDCIVVGLDGVARVVGASRPEVRDRAPRGHGKRVPGARSAPGRRFGRRAGRRVQRRRHAVGGAEPAPVPAGSCSLRPSSPSS